MAATDVVDVGVSASPPSFSGSLPDPQVWLASLRAPGPGLSELSITPAVATALTWTVRVRFQAALSTAATVHGLWKPFDNGFDWSAVDASATGDGSYSATVSSEGSGAMFAAEVRDGQGAWRYPDPRAATPYVPLPP